MKPFNFLAALALAVLPAVVSAQSYPTKPIRLVVSFPERIDEMLGRPEVDPHGDPIPSAEGELASAHLPALDSLAAGVRARIARVVDREPEFLKLVERPGLRPGAKVRVVARDAAADALELDLGRGKRAILGLRAAAKIFVEGG